MSSFILTQTEVLLYFVCRDEAQPESSLKVHAVLQVPENLICGRKKTPSYQQCWRQTQQIHGFVLFTPNVVQLLKNSIAVTGL